MNKRFRYPLIAVVLLITSVVVGCLLTTYSSSIATPTLPRPTSSFYVLDEAQVISPEVENQILAINQELNTKTKAQIVVVTLKDARELTLEDLGLGILREWGVGDKQLNNGLVMLVIPEERSSRIEVGYGLEGALPDGKTGRIQDEYMIPFFKEGNFDQGILNGFLVLAQEVAKEYQVTLNTQTPTTYRPEGSGSAEELSTGQLLLIIIGLLLLYIVDRRFFNGYIFAMLLSMLFRGGGGGRGGGGFSGGGGSGGGGGSSRNW